MGLFDKIKQTVVDAVQEQFNVQVQTPRPQQQSEPQPTKKLSNAEMIQQEVAKFRGKFQDSDFFLPQNGSFNITRTYETKIRQLHHISDTEPIYLIFDKTVTKDGGIFSADRTFRYSLLFLEKEISFISVQQSSGWLDEDGFDDLVGIEWTLIKEVEASYNRVNLFLHDSTDIVEIKFSHFNDDLFYGLGEQDNKLLAFLIGSIIKQYTDIWNESADLISDLMSAERYSEALEKIKESIALHGEKSYDSAVFYYYQAQCYYYINEYDKAYKSMQYLQDIKKEKNEELSDYHYFAMSKILEKQGKLYSSLRMMNRALQTARKNEDKEDYLDCIKVLSQKLQEDFTQFPVEQRKYVIIGKQFKEFPTRNVIGLQKDFLPQIRINGSFSENEVYVVHPYLSDVYLPFKGFENLLLVEKFSELQYIMQCLGAKEVTIQYLSGKKVEEMNFNSNDIGGGVSYKGIGLSGSNELSNSSFKSNSNTHGIAMQQSFQQTNTAPYLPDNLVWYPNESRWQQLYQQRLNGSILKDSILISNENISKGSSSELEDVQASLSFSVFSANANWKDEHKHEFLNEEKTKWSINVEFYPLNTESNVSTPSQPVSVTSSTDNEQKYIDEITFLFEDDGEIDEDERRMLERKRQKFGISEARAKELEQQITDTNKLTESEQEYQDEYKEILIENGEITENLRRVLDRLRTKLNISEQRAKEIEGMVKHDTSNQYTEQELKYIEEIKFCLEDDNEIGLSERRMLNKERDKLGISEERADEIEKEFIKTITR